MANPPDKTVDVPLGNLSPQGSKRFLDSTRRKLLVRLLGLCTDRPKAVVCLRQLGQATHMLVPYNPLALPVFGAKRRWSATLRRRATLRWSAARCWKVTLRRGRNWRIRTRRGASLQAPQLENPHALERVPLQAGKRLGLVRRSHLRSKEPPYLVDQSPSRRPGPRPRTTGSPPQTCE